MNVCIYVQIELCMYSGPIHGRITVSSVSASLSHSSEWDSECGHERGPFNFFQVFLTDSESWLAD